MRFAMAVCVTSMLIGCYGCGVEAPTGAPTHEERIHDGTVSATRVANGIRLANDTSVPVAYVIWNRAWLGLIAPCIDATPDCLRLAAGAIVTVREVEILGYTAGMTEAVVRFWRVVPDAAGQLRAQDIREVTIRF